MHHAFMRSAQLRSLPWDRTLIYEDRTQNIVCIREYCKRHNSFQTFAAIFQFFLNIVRVDLIGSGTVEQPK